MQIIAFSGFNTKSLWMGGLAGGFRATKKLHQYFRLGDGVDAEH